YGRGSGLELGLLTPHPADPDPNQVVLAGLAESSAPPPADPVGRQIGPVNLNPLLWASLLRGTAETAFDPTTCAVGRPIAFGQGEVAKVQLLNTGGVKPNGEFVAPLLETSLPEDRNVAQSRTFSYLVANGDGTFGVVSETHQQVLPISLLNGQITIELLGEWVLRATATGRPGGAKVEYAPVGAGPETAVLRIKLFANPPLTLKLQQLLGDDGLDLSIPNVLQLRVGTPPRPIGDHTSPQPAAPVAADGTSASAAVDVVRLSVLDYPGLTGLDLRVGHMEAAVTAPAGGVTCQIPVSKTAQPDPVTAGDTVTHTITIPSDDGAFARLFDCDLVAIRAEDVVSTRSGSPKYRVTEASNGGVVSADGRKVTWGDLGTYHPGDPPIVLTVKVLVPADSPGGVIEDTVAVTADLGNCKGGGGGGVLVGQSKLNGTVMGGAATRPGPTITPAAGGGGGAAGVTIVSGGATTTPAQVLGVSATRPDEQGRAAAGDQLGRTGFDVAVLVALGLWLLAAGAMVTTVIRSLAYRR
ncbi:MAG TPA: hypothetical protein VFO65_11350, partial [Acidimicrobiales bacterium]|nr:hypothetical protein [Acidimicrobiales bacterium]